MTSMTPDSTRKICELAPKRATTALRLQLRAIRDQITPLREENVDAIHDMRVASRRLRAVLAEHRRLFERTAFDRASDFARTITRGLGRARELDVTLGILKHIRRRARGSLGATLAHVVRHTQEIRKAESPHIAESASLAASRAFSKAYRDLIAGIQPRSKCYLKSAVNSLLKRHDSAARSYTKWRRNQSPETLHRLRINFKKLRYACETHRVLYDESLTGFINSLKDLQEALGDWHDWVVIGDCVSAAAPDAAGGLDELNALVDAEIDKHLGQFAQRSEHFFSKHYRAETRRILSSPSQACCRGRNP